MNYEISKEFITLLSDNNGNINSSNSLSPSSTLSNQTHHKGHSRKRSLSAPTAPLPSSEIQDIPIQRNPKHSSQSSQPPMSSEEYQRKLNEELEKVDFNDITVSELKDLLRQRNKPATGKKAILMKRLQEEIKLVKAMKNNKGGAGIDGLFFQDHPMSAPATKTEFFVSLGDNNVITADNDDDIVIKDEEMSNVNNPGSVTAIIDYDVYHQQPSSAPPMMTEFNNNYEFINHQIHNKSSLSIMDDGNDDSQMMMSDDPTSSASTTSLLNDQLVANGMFKIFYYFPDFNSTTNADWRHLSFLYQLAWLGDIVEVANS
ncbi:13565_t:CDS:2 [Entrophospora sp. SA101]|nr:13565_t:CDS:2 [Entrophospora sp. SA101]